MGDWIADHPYMTGGFFIGAIALYFLYSSSGTDQQAVQATGLSPEQLAIQAQNAQLQAAANSQTQQLQTALAAKQIDAAVAQSQIDAALAAKKLDNEAIQTANDKTIAGQLQLAGLQTQALGIQANAQSSALQAQFEYQRYATSTLASRDINIAGIQGDVAQAEIKAALEGLKDTNKTAFDISKLKYDVDTRITDNDLLKTYSNNTTLAMINQSNNDTTKFGIQANLDYGRMAFDSTYNLAVLSSSDKRYLTDADVLKTLSSNVTQVDLAKINSQTQQLAITTQGDVYKHGITVQGQTDQHAITTTGATVMEQLKLQTQALNLFSSGVFNKGGEGGANQVSAFGGLVNQPSIGAPAQAAQTGSVVSSWLNGIANIGSAVFGGRGIGGVTAPTNLPAG